MLELPLFDGRWSINTEGEIRIVKSFHKRKEGHLLKLSVSRCGYYMCNTAIDGKTVNFYVHRLVAQAFIPNPDNLPQVNHIDGNKLNNHVSNLEWCTQSHNMRHAHRTGLKYGLDGVKNGNSKLTELECVQLIHELRNGMSNTEAGIKYNLHSRYISLIRHKRRWKSLWREIEGATTIENTQ